LGEILLSESIGSLQEVVVRAERIIRQADRFIVNLANDPTVFGKTGTDILNLSPGVFIQERDGEISINGKSGSRVYVNGRPRHESGTDLVRYLQTLRAEDIVRIEVLPTAGAEYDADIAGGVINITLKRQREDGINGNAGVSYEWAPSDDFSRFSPSIRLNYKINRLSFYTQLNYFRQTLPVPTTEEINMWTANRNIRSATDASETYSSQTSRIGGVYDLNEMQSIGMEVSYSGGKLDMKNYTDLTEITNGNLTDATSVYTGKRLFENYSATANYILRLDDAGSLFKILFDYHQSSPANKQDYRTEFRGYLDYDTIYRSDISTRNNMYAVNADLLLRVNDNSTFNTGLKYVHNKMNNEILFESLNGTNWNMIDPFSSINSFSEDIAAVYGMFSSRVNKMSYSIGLRGEYTQATPWTNKSADTKKQNYFELFPSANVMLPLGGTGKHTLVLNYNRKIVRPSFSEMNPFSTPVSEFSYIEGNPDLKAALPNDFSVVLRLFNRYNIVAGITDTKGAIERVTVVKPDRPDVIIMRLENEARNTTYYLNLNGSVKPFAWWQININLSGRRNEIEVFNQKRAMNIFNGYMANSFFLPNDFIFDLNGNYMSPFLFGNMELKVTPTMNASFRKQFFAKKLTASIFANNVFDSGELRLKVNEDDFKRNSWQKSQYRSFGVSLNYSFQAGKSVQVKNVQSGAAEDKARLQ
jgi:hypothetical protein